MNKDDYEDIINLSHYEPKNHKRMSIVSRSAQFAPFSALVGYDDEVKETARLTNTKIEIDENLKNILNDKLNIIKKHIKEKPLITFTYFVHDIKKSGGEYIDLTGYVRQINENNNIVILTDKTKILIEEIINIRGNIFNDLNLE